MNFPEIPDVDILDYWKDEQTKMAYCIYIDKKLKETSKCSNIRFAEGRYDDQAKN